MAEAVRDLLSRGAVLCRTCAATLIAGLWPGRDLRDVNARLSGCPVGQQAAITAAVLGLLFLLGLVAAQFGWIGILLFWMAVIFVAR